MTTIDKVELNVCLMTCSWTNLTTFHNIQKIYNVNKTKALLKKCHNDFFLLKNGPSILCQSRCILSCGQILILYGDLQCKISHLFAGSGFLHALASWEYTLSMLIMNN